MDKTEKVMEQMVDLVRDMAYSADEMCGRHGDARSEYERLSEENEFLASDDDGRFLAADLNDAFDAMEEYADDFHTELDTFDKQLMKLIQLRGKLAEVTGIPIGGKQWVRLEQYEM